MPIPSTALSRAPAPLVSALLLALPMVSMAQSHHFDVLHGSKVVGEVQAHKTVNGELTHYLMTSDSQFWMLWKQTVQSYAVSEYIGVELIACHTSFHHNGDLRDSSHMQTVEGKYRSYVDPDERFDHPSGVEWTTARMYFEEPIGRATIYVESALRYCSLEKTDSHSYRLQLPDGKVNTYTYTNGVLQKIFVERRFVDLIFQRS